MSAPVPTRTPQQRGSALDAVGWAALAVILGLLLMHGLSLIGPLGDSTQDAGPTHIVSSQQVGTGASAGHGVGADATTGTGHDAQSGGGSMPGMAHAMHLCVAILAGLLLLVGCALVRRAVDDPFHPLSRLTSAVGAMAPPPSWLRPSLTTLCIART